MVPIPRLYRRLLRYAQRGRPRDVSPDRGVEQLIQDLGVRAGISKRVYPHLLRRSYATWALDRGMNPVMLAHILGHTSQAMIQNVYRNRTPTDAYEAMVRALAEGEVASSNAAASRRHLLPYREVNG